MKVNKFRAKMQDENYKGFFAYSIYPSVSWFTKDHILYPGKIDYDTVGQYIGISDKYKQDIFEDDIIEEGLIGEIIWDGNGIIELLPNGLVIMSPLHTNLKQLSTGLVKLIGEGVDSVLDRIATPGYSELNLNCYDGLFWWCEDIKIIGNKYQNPELINTGAKLNV